MRAPYDMSTEKQEQNKQPARELESHHFNQKDPLNIDNDFLKDHEGVFKRVKELLILKEAKLILDQDSQNLNRAIVKNNKGEIIFSTVLGFEIDELADIAYNLISDKDLLKRVPVMPRGTKHHQYQELGGIINETDYNSTLERAKNTTTLDEALIKQAEKIAKFAGIELQNTENTIDPRTILYGILRRDVTPKDIRHHHGSMSDQRIFMEALRMLKDVESLDKMIKAYPNISFKYKAGNDN